jgi:hypothetical protein
LERQGLATVQLASVRSYPERIRPPRALYCEFPLGRPLGRPGDADFQRAVLMAAFALLARRDVPVLEDFPERIVAAADEPIACRLPPRFDAGLHPAVEEALGLRPAYDRRRESGARRAMAGADADAVPGLLRGFAAIDCGEPVDATALGGDLRAAALAVRTYYEEAAVALSEHVPEARRAEAWFYRSTEAGALLRRVQAVLRERGAPFRDWYFLVPLTQQDGRDGVLSPDA